MFIYSLLLVLIGISAQCFSMEDPNFGIQSQRKAPRRVRAHSVVSLNSSQLLQPRARGYSELGSEISPLQSEQSSEVLAASKEVDYKDPIWRVKVMRQVKDRNVRQVLCSLNTYLASDNPQINRIAYSAMNDYIVQALKKLPQNYFDEKTDGYEQISDRIFLENEAHEEAKVKAYKSLSAKLSILNTVAAEYTTENESIEPILFTALTRHNFSKKEAEEVVTNIAAQLPHIQVRTAEIAAEYEKAAQEKQNEFKNRATVTSKLPQNPISLISDIRSLRAKAARKSEITRALILDALLTELPNMASTENLTQSEQKLIE